MDSTYKGEQELDQHADSTSRKFRFWQQGRHQLPVAPASKVSLALFVRPAPPGPIEKFEHPRKTPVAASPEASTPFLIFLCGSAEQMHF